MGIKLVDTAVPMNEDGYPVAWAKNIWFDDNSSLQAKLDNNELGSGGSGSTVKLADVSGASVTTYMTTASITWTDPDNAVVDGVVMQDWAGTLVVRKEGSSPRNKDDGIVVVDNYTKNLYASTPFKDEGLEYGKTYYYRFFPYSSNDVYTNGTSISVVPERVKIAVVPTLNGTYTYNGSLQTAVFDNFDENQLDVSGNTATNAGSYTVTFTPKSDYCWSDGTMDAREVAWSIEKVAVAIPTINTILTYNGSTQSPTVNGYDAMIMNVSGDTSATNAGNYTITYSLKSTQNYYWSDGSISDKSITWSIGKADGNVVLSSTEVTLDDDNVSATVTVSDNTGVVTVESSNSDYVEASISGNIITLTSPEQKIGSSIVTVNVAESDNYNATTKNISVICRFSGLDIVTFADGTLEQIGSMIEAHYSGAINISDYWSVGDTKTISLSEMYTADGVGETQPAQNAEIVIIGIEHDDLTTPINDKTKAAVTLQLKNVLGVAGYMFSSSYGTSYSLWSNSTRRTWCNNTFKNALPSELINLIKTVTKKTWRYAYSTKSGYRTQQTTEDDCFLISEFEACGTQKLSSINYGTVGDDGTQYEYYKTSSNRIKYNGTSVIGYWLRSSVIESTGNSYFLFIKTDGSVNYVRSEYDYYLAPAFCI